MVYLTHHSCICSIFNLWYACPYSAPSRIFFPHACYHRNSHHKLKWRNHRTKNPHALTWLLNSIHQRPRCIDHQRPHQWTPISYLMVYNPCYQGTTLDVGELLYITVPYVLLAPFVREPKRFIPPLEDLSSAERSMYNGFNSFISLASPNILSALTYILTYDFDKIDFTTLPTLPTPHIDATVRHAYCEHISKMLITEFLKDKELTSSLEIDYIWPITHNRIGHPASCSTTSE